jgi:hypothetical protein
VLFETIIAVLRPLANQGCGVSGGHHPATCASATNSATVMMNNTASASVIGHMTRPSNWSTMIHAVAAVTESRRPSSFTATSRKRRRCAG